MGIITIRALITREYPDNNSTALSSVKFIKNFMNINKNHIDKSIIKDITNYSSLNGFMNFYTFDFLFLKL